MDLEDKILLADEGYLSPRYPRNVARAFVSVSYDDRDEESEDWDDRPYQEVMRESVVSFAQRWGGLDDATFLRVLREGTGRDKFAAIFAIGFSKLAEASEILAPLLQSPDLLERCAAACCLGLKKDERALPVLKEYLLQDPPLAKPGQYVPEARLWYIAYRGILPRTLATWGPPSMTPILRQAFIQIWERNKQYQPGGSEFYTHDALCYALGRRGAMAALHGIDLPPRQRRLAMFHLALGSVRADERFEDPKFEVICNRELQQEMLSVFADQFGLSAEEGQAILDSQYDDNRKREYWWEEESESDSSTEDEVEDMNA